MTWIDFLDKNVSAVFSLMGVFVGIIADYFRQKFNQKFQRISDESKKYFKRKSEVLNKSLQLSLDYEFELNTLHDTIDNEYGIPIGIKKEEDVFIKYFTLIYEFLHSNRLYLEEETIKELDKLSNSYIKYKLATKIISSEYNNEDIHNEIQKKKKELFNEQNHNFNQLIEEIKYTNLKKYKETMEGK